MKSNQLVILLVFYLLLACQSNKVFLSMPSTPETSADGGYGVVNVPYLRINSQADIKGDVLATLRLGDIVTVREIRNIYDADKGATLTSYYITFNDDVLGWVTSDYLNVFKYMYTSQEFSKKMREDNS